VDLFRLPVLGSVARWRHTRRLAQGVLLAVAAGLVVHGLFGPPIAPRNAATVFTWVHYRGLLVISILAIGNLFCTACPMILVRDAGRRVAHPAFRWPRRLRGKWLALALFAAVLFAYELFDLWELPRATAWLVLGYFATALVVDVLFAGASFCKYVCPVGQFNFAASLMSPTELQVRDIGTCRSCRTSDCIKGRPPGVGGGRLRGCELGLFLPMKVGNLDCTLCLDCVRACPHDNIGLMTRMPGAELLDTRRRSGIGRLTQRPDLAALAVLFTFGALLNAFAMTAPAAQVGSGIATAMSARSEAPVLASVFLAGLVVLPVILLVAASATTRVLAGREGPPLRMTAIRYAYTLVPLGFGMWLAHYGFHFLTGVLTVVPVVQSAAIDFAGAPVLGEPLWRWAGMRPGAVFPIQLGFVVIGAAGSMTLAYATSARDHSERAGLASVPWLVLMAALAAAALWILAQPMDMRGMGAIG
jgi:polyferredoxin